MKLTGNGVQRLMRRHRITIRQLAAKMNVTQKRVRQVRHDGVEGVLMTTDWLEAITGEPWFARVSSAGAQSGNLQQDTTQHRRQRLPVGRDSTIIER